MTRKAQILPGELHAEESTGFIYMHKANWKLPLHEIMCRAKIIARLSGRSAWSKVFRL